jgi:hypothetical protein
MNTCNSYMKTNNRIFRILGIALLLCGLLADMSAQPRLVNISAGAVRTARPLDEMLLADAPGKTLVVADGAGKEYFRTPVKPVVAFTVGGALGRHTLRILDTKDKETARFPFLVDAETDIDDDGYYKQMFDLFHKGMYSETGNVRWNGKTYQYFVPWGLDHCHTMKGLKYFSGAGREFVDLMRAVQREDGMIWSFVHGKSNPDYFLTRDKFSGYTQKIGDCYFTRQPTENHPEYIYVNTIYQCWKADGDDAWMKENLSSAARALDYGMNDPARWSTRFQLLKRVYTIDSWDFAAEDEYLPDLGLTNSMIIDPVKSKFGVFFGDNTGYAKACRELAEMYRHAGLNAEAGKYAQRAKDISARLDALTWNGRFYTHFIDEDPAVKRKFGVDEKSQIAQSNAYSLNRDIRPDQKKAIVETYLRLKNNLPVGSPGEWYAIFPPFQKGFGGHNSLWQYMNGGVGGHVAGELALGAYESGYEAYGTDILNRLFELGKKYDDKIWFAYTGSTPPPPPSPVFKPLDLSGFANMDHCDRGGEGVFAWMNATRKGDDLCNLPTGAQIFADIHFRVIDPEKNNRKSVTAVSKQKGFPASIEIPVNDSAGAVYLLHTSSKPTSENVVGVVTFVYADGTRRVHYMLMDKHLTYWWFSQLKTDYSGIAWYGKNAVSEGVGLSWCAIDNPEPGKIIQKIVLQAPEDNGIYTVFGLSLSDRPHYVPVKPTSFGGPDNWAAATAMAGLVEGLAGVKNAPDAQAYSTALIAPRWTTTGVDSIRVNIRYPASGAYVAYQYRHHPEKRQIELVLTGSGQALQGHVLLPEAAREVVSVSKNGAAHPFQSVRGAEGTRYADFAVENKTPCTLTIQYR